MAPTLSMPGPVKSVFAYFPLHTNPAIPPPASAPILGPTLWILPPAEPHSHLSADVECLKWQTYLALRLPKTRIRVRWDIAVDGAVDRRLPNLQLPKELMAAAGIAAWVDGMREDVESSGEGYRSQALADESRPWIALLEGPVHAALSLSQPPVSSWESLIWTDIDQPSTDLSIPPKTPRTGLLSVIPVFLSPLSHPPRESILQQYSEAILALSERLGKDHWLLNSEHPTALDALLFAYLHCILRCPPNGDIDIRKSVTRHVNLVAWEKKVFGLVTKAYGEST